MKFLSLFLFVSMIFIASACEDQSLQKTDKKIPTPAVTVVLVTARDVNDIAEDVARTKATARVQIRAQVTGILKSQSFEEGSYVQAGDLLLEIDPAHFEANLAVATAAVALAKASQQKAKLYLARLKGMRAGAVAAVDLDAAISDAAVADANLRQMESQWKLAKLDLDYSRITAPISGRIGASSIDVGNLVTANGDTLATIVQPDPIEVSWSISERIMTSLKSELIARGASLSSIDDEVVPKLRLSNGKEYKHAGEIFFIDNEVNPRTGTITIRARFPNPDELLIPGQFVTALIPLNSHQQSLLIPQASVQQDMEGYFVLVVREDNTVEQRHVLLGNRFGTEWIVQQGLESGEKVIYMGLEKVMPGTIVNPAQENTPAFNASDNSTAKQSARSEP